LSRDNNEPQALLLQRLRRFLHERVHIIFKPGGNMEQAVIRMLDTEVNIKSTLNV
jgi:hypothetical protein